MKKIILLSFVIIKSLTLCAQEKVQIKLTPASPSASFVQELGNTTIKVNYSRPLVKDRKIFGELVPFDQIWRTGASDATQFSVNKDITFGGNKLVAGDYSLFSIPSKNEWTIIVNTDTKLHGDSEYDEKKDIFRFKIASEKSAHFYETFTIEINDITTKGEAFLKLMWENTMIKIPIKSKDDDTIMELINQNLMVEKIQDATLLFQAANYYNLTKRDTKQAITWLLQAEKMEPDNYNFPYLRQKMAASTKDYPVAIDAAKKAVKNAELKKMKSQDILKKQIKEWELLLKN